MFTQKKIDWDKVKLRLPEGNKLRGKWAQVYPREVYEYVVGEILPTTFELPEVRVDLSLAGQVLTIAAWVGPHLAVIQTGTTTKIIPRLYAGRMTAVGIPIITEYEPLYNSSRDGDILQCIKRTWTKLDRMFRQTDKLLRDTFVSKQSAQSTLFTAARHGIIAWSRLGLVDKDMKAGLPLLEAGIKQILRGPVVKRPEALYLWTHMALGKGADKQRESA